jgi:anti-anti-sigma factor
MPTGGFDIKVERDGPRVVLAPHGELDLDTVGSVRQAFREHADATSVLLDLRGLTFIDSSGVTLILEQVRRAEADGFAFGLVRGSTRVQRLFEVTGLIPHLTWVDVPGAPGSNRNGAEGQ